jgi:DNA-directed RNA polymerase subunit RPC12/RpoP
MINSMFKCPRCGGDLAMDFEKGIQVCQGCQLTKKYSSCGGAFYYDENGGTLDIDTLENHDFKQPEEISGSLSFTAEEIFARYRCARCGVNAIESIASSVSAQCGACGGEIIPTGFEIHIQTLKEKYRLYKSIFGE